MSSEDWPDRQQIRQRRAEFVASELQRLHAQQSVDIGFEADLRERQRASLAQANQFHLDRDPRPLGARLGYAHNDGIPATEAGNDYGEAVFDYSGEGGVYPRRGDAGEDISGS